MHVTGMSWLIKPVLIKSLMMSPVPNPATPLVMLNEFHLPIAASRRFVIEVPLPGNFWLMVRPEQSWGSNSKKNEMALMWAPTYHSYYGFSVGVDPKHRQANTTFQAGYYTRYTTVSFGAQYAVGEKTDFQFGLKIKLIR